MKPWASCSVWRIEPMNAGDATVARRLGHIDNAKPTDFPELAIAGHLAHDARHAIGVVFQAIGVLFFLWNVVSSLRRGTLGELVSHVCSLPESERKQLVMIMPNPVPLYRQVARLVYDQSDKGGG